MTDAFAAAVESYQDALARFEGAPPPHRRAVDWSEHREVTVPAEEAELEARFGRGTRSAGGGGETLSPAAPMKPRKERPDKQSAGWARRKAAARQREEEAKMPKGVKLDTAAVLVALDTTVGRTALSIAEKLGVGEGPVSKRLRDLEADGRARRVGGGTGYAPTVWAAVSTRGADPGPSEHEPQRKGNGKGVSTSNPPPEPPAAAEMYGAFAFHGPVYARIGAEIEQEARRRAAAILRQTADRLDAEAAGSAA